MNDKFISATLVALLAVTFLIGMQPAQTSSIKFVQKGDIRFMQHVHENDKADLIGSLSVIKSDKLVAFNSPFFATLDKSVIQQMPPCVIDNINVIAAIHAKGITLDNVAIVGDLYIYPVFREKGYAKKFVEQVVNDLFEKEGIEYIALIPHPFEYVDNIQKTLRGTAEYEPKKEQLIKLYAACGFKKDTTNGTVFMYKQK